MKISDIRMRGSVSPWVRLGFETRELSRPGEHFIAVPDLVLRFDDPDDSVSTGLAGWSFIDESAERTVDVQTEIDGIPTRLLVIDPKEPAGVHRLDIVGVDHVVVMTGSLDRTCSAISATIGEPLRRVRDAGGGVRQGFHKAGRVILEVVERPDLEPDTPASLWGLVFNVSDLDAAAAWLGPDAISSPRDAVQPGRRIATIRSSADLGVPVALMSTGA